MGLLAAGLRGVDGATQPGVGVGVAAAAGALTGILTLIAAQVIFAAVRSPLIRMSIAVLFAAPAAFAGFHATHGIAALTMPSWIWQMIFAVTGSVAVGATTWTRMAMLTPAPPVRGNAGRQVQP